MLIGEKITYYRKRMNLTQEALSDGICASSLLSKIENNKAEATLLSDIIPMPYYTAI